MALTVAQLAGAIRVGDGTTDPKPPLLDILVRLNNIGTALVAKFAPGAPEAIQDEATVRVASYLYDQPASGRGMAYAAAWHNSGAASLVSPWVKQRTAVSNDDKSIVVDSTGAIRWPGL